MSATATALGRRLGEPQTQTVSLVASCQDESNAPVDEKQLLMSRRNQ